MSDLPPREVWANTTRDATNFMLDAARWLVGVLGVMLAALVAGAQLSNVGQLDTNDARLWVAAGAAVLALVGVGGALIAVLRIGAGAVDLDKLTADELASAQQTGLLVGYDSAEAFFAERKARLAHWAHLNDPRRPELFVPRDIAGDTIQPLMRDRLAEMAWEQYELAALIPYYRTRRRYLFARRVLLIGGVVAAISLLVLAWAANPPEDDPAPSGGPAAESELGLGRQDQDWFDIGGPSSSSIKRC